ncbi:hypothetical protein ES332_A03G110900v1 [Gossypium tomentosum]|uniref:DUF4283 domain-containing protein n=1 Tax=Gossypium tomentosum TaxID=34277 RepID=A0A5D2R6G9_GOSTO|nr:hypothetical protein ES332_A03G110900v1 [Gossypium tomentosum]
MNKKLTNIQRCEAWAIGKIISEEKVNKEAMYHVIEPLWFIKEEVSFVALNDGVILVKFGNIDDRMRILNLIPWLFNQCLFALFPFIKGQELDGYVFNITPFWIRTYNIPFEQMDRHVAIDVGKVIGESEGTEKVHAIKYERPPTFFQLGGSTQNRANWRNGIETLEKKINSSEENNDNKTGNGVENDFTSIKGKEKSRGGEEELKSGSFMEKHQQNQHVTDGAD